MERPGMYIVVDGIDGSGKTTVLKHIQATLSDMGKRVFDSHAWFAESETIPDYSDVSNHDVFFTIEPTKAMIGLAIRQELAFNDIDYAAIDQAHAFALDRKIQLNKLILPALNNGKIVIQDRSVSTSIVYQSRMDDTINREEILQLPGNAFALQNAPDHLILTHIDPNTAFERANKRTEKPTEVYEKREKQRQFHEDFHSDEFKRIFTKNGTQIHTIDTSTNLQDTLTQTTSLFTSLLSKHL